MTTPHESNGELKRLIDAVVEESATPAQMARLESILTSAATARRFYRQSMQLHANLQWRFREEAISAEWFAEGESVLPMTESSGKTIQARRKGRWLTFTMAAAMVVLLVVGTLAMWQSRNLQIAGNGSGVEGLATLSDAVDCLWGSGRLPTSIGSRLESGTLQLARGMAEIRFDCGARLILVGPAVLEIQGRARAFLRQGSVTVRVSHEATGFVLQTPSSRVVDLGTEFGVRTEDSGASRIVTFEGKVEVESAGDLMGQQQRGDGVRHAQPLMAGQGLDVSADGHSCRLMPNATDAGFLRVLPQRDANVAENRYVRTVLSDRPMGYWRFEEETPADSAPATDASGHRHDGRYRGNVSSTQGVPGIGGRAARFDGTSGMVCVPHHADFSLRSISVELWLRTEEEWNHTYWPGDAVLISKDVPGVSTDWCIIGGSRIEGRNEGRVIVGVGTSSGPDKMLQSMPKLNNGAWHHVVWTRDRSGMNRLYIDGVFAGSIQDGGGSINNPMDIGIGGSLQSAVSNRSGDPVDVKGRPLNDRSYLCGELDEMAIYDHVLSPQRILAHYRAGTSGP
jgi:hypothetical protein